MRTGLAGAIAAFVSIVAAALAAPAASQALWGGASWDEPPGTGGADVNEGRFVAMGGIFGGQRIDCIRCHEIDGSGNSSGAFPRLADQSGWYLYKSLHDYAMGLRPSDIMEPIARTLTDGQMRDVAAYYASITDAPYPAEPEADLNVIQIGGAIAAIGIPGQGVPACSSCHGENGIGNVPVVPYLAGQFAPYLENQLILWKKGRRDGDPMNVMELVARNMTEEQIYAVSVYFASIRPSEVTPNDPGFGASEPQVTPPVLSGAPALERSGTDTGAVASPETSGAGTVVPGAEPSATLPETDFPVGLPRRPLPPGALPPYLSPPPAGEGLDSTTTTTGELPENESQ